MARRPKRVSARPAWKPGQADGPLEVRIIGGKFRGRKLAYSGDPGLRPMKDRVREAVFNLLGPAVVGKQVLDVFAGTGALALEALSRGAAKATLLEQHYPTAELIRRNLALLDAADRAELVHGDAFHWCRTHTLSPDPPWLVFVSPPYAFFQQRRQELLALVARLMEQAPPESMLVVESDLQFSAEDLPAAPQWRVRDYPPTRVAIFRKQAA